MVADLGAVPRAFWVDLLCAALPLLEDTAVAEPIFDRRQTEALLAALAEARLRGADDPGRLGELRLALGRNLSRAIVTEATRRL